MAPNRSESPKTRNTNKWSLSHELSEDGRWVPNFTRARRRTFGSRDEGAAAAGEQTRRVYGGEDAGEVDAAMHAKVRHNVYQNAPNRSPRV